MDLTTRCPHCASEFPISLQQLQLRKGYIRCVECAHIFDGYEAVVPTSPPPVASSAAALTETVPEPTFSVSTRPAAPAADEPRFVVSAAETTAVPIRKRVTPGSAIEPPVFTVRDPEHRSQQVQRHTVGAAGLDAGRAGPHDEDGPGLYAEPRSGRQANDQFDHESERSGLSLGGLFWSLLIVCGLAGAILQAAYIYRVQLASEFPVLRPALERYCETLDCTVEYPRRLAQIVVMDSSLQAVPGADGDSGDKNNMMLNVVLRNNFERPQQWPALSLDLVDFSGVVAARRILAPSDYLPELSLQRPFPAKSEVRVSVPVTVADMQINGYQLNTFFP